MTGRYPLQYLYLVRDKDSGLDCGEQGNRARAQFLTFNVSGGVFGSPTAWKRGRVVRSKLGV